MGNLESASNEDVAILSAHSEQRTTVLAALAKIIAKAHLRKTLSDKNGSIELTLPNSRNNYINDINNGDGSQL